MKILKELTIQCFQATAILILIWSAIVILTVIVGSAVLVGMHFLTR